MSTIDTTFDLRSDTPLGKDPDTFSPTLRRYHQQLWSKELPSGDMFSLDTLHPRCYLFHESDRGRFILSSDTVMQTFTGWTRMQSIVESVAAGQRGNFVAAAYTIGGMMVWPGVPQKGRQTINVARGFNNRIADRMDLTLECVRRHYEGGTGPLGPTLEAYSDFFDLFETFADYVRFFLLDDLVEENYTSVKFFLPFNDFSTGGAPTDAASYREFMERSMEFVQARNSRIEHFAGANIDRSHHDHSP